MKKPTRVTHPPEVELPEGNASLVRPVYRSVKFTYESIEQSLSKEARENGFDYTRDANPTTRELELLCAELQERDDAIAVATGMAAIWLTLLANLEAGDRVLIFLETYRPTRVAVRKFLPRLGIEHAVASILDADATSAALADPSVKLLLFESPTNPMLHVPDIAALAAQCRRNGVISVLDNTFAGLHSHGRYDVDYFVHSLTKFAGGHGDAMGGVVVASKENIRRLRPLAVNMGSTIDPGGSFLMLRGLKTYYLRYRQHCENALAIAEFLLGRSEVRRVRYPGLPDDPGYALATEQMQGYGGVVTFELEADREKTWGFIDALSLFATTASLGSTESLVAPVKLYLGGDLSAAELETAGITDSMVRLAVGTEDPDDLIADLSAALDETFG